MAAQARSLIADGTVSGGMIPKLETCLQALDDGVGAAHVLDGRLPHVVLLETFTEPASEPRSRSLTRRLLPSNPAGGAGVCR